MYIGSKTSMVVDDLLKSFLDDYQFSLRTKMKKSNLTHDRVRAFYYKLMQYAISAALNYQQIDDHPERMSKIKRFINKYDWKDKFSIT